MRFWLQAGIPHTKKYCSQVTRRSDLNKFPGVTEEQVLEETSSYCKSIILVTYCIIFEPGSPVPPALVKKHRFQQC